MSGTPPPAPYDPFARIVALLEFKKAELAESESRRVLEVDPDSADGLLLLAISLHEQNRRAEALAVAQRAVAAGPDNPLTHLTVALVLVTRRPHLSRLLNAWRAQGYAAAALRLAPNDPDCLGLAAHVAILQLRPGTALRYAQQGLSVAPDHADCLLQRAQALEMENRFEEADAASAELLAASPMSFEAHSARGWSLLGAGEFRAAETHFRQAITLAPEAWQPRLGYVRARRARWFGLGWPARRWTRWDWFGKNRWGCIGGCVALKLLLAVAGIGVFFFSSLIVMGFSIWFPWQLYAFAVDLHLASKDVVYRAGLIRIRWALALVTVLGMLTLAGSVAMGLFRALAFTGPLGVGGMAAPLLAMLPLILFIPRVRSRGWRVGLWLGVAALATLAVGLQYLQRQAGADHSGMPLPTGFEHAGSVWIILMVILTSLALWKTTSPLPSREF